MHRGFSRMGIQCYNIHSSAYLTPCQLPSPMGAHLWYIKPGEVKCESLIKQYFDILSPCEREKVLEMKGEELRKCALLSRVLVRTTIARYSSQIDPKALKFRKNIYGKPQIDLECANARELVPLHFNISHTPTLVACAINSSSNIGVDVEEKQRRIMHDIISFAKRYFTKNEIQFLSNISDPQVQRLEFLKLWTLKESYVKAIGKGFSGAPFKTFNISYKSTVERVIIQEDQSEREAMEVVVNSVENSSDFTANCQFLLLELANSHYAAICSEKHSSSDGYIPLKLNVWRTIPYVEDEYVSGTDAVKFICGSR